MSEGNKNTNNLPDRTELKKANTAYTECITREFLGRFLAGDKVAIDDFCVKERETMKKLDE